MWFKQLSVYLLNRDSLPDLSLLSDKLQAAAFTPCMGLDWSSTGFAPPARFAPDEWVFPANQFWRVALKTEDKVLPAAVVREELEEKIQAIYDAEGRNVGRKEKQELKENIVDSLLPRAFTKSRVLEAIINPQAGLLLVNQANANKAGDLVSHLREALGGLDAKLPKTQQTPAALMTKWLMQGHADGGFELDSDCELKGLGDAASVVRISKQDLTAEEVAIHLKNGKTATQVGLCWQDRVRFVLTQDWTLKRIQFLDVLQEEAENHGDDLPSLMMASQILMTEALSELVLELSSLLGGWEV